MLAMIKTLYRVGLGFLYKHLSVHRIRQIVPSKIVAGSEEFGCFLVWKLRIFQYTPVILTKLQLSELYKRIMNEA
jgi:hypothetical protein